MQDSAVYITIAFTALFIVGWIFLKQKRINERHSLIATTAVLLNIAAIIIGETQFFSTTLGYGLTSAGLVLSIVGIFRRKRKKKLISFG